MPANAFPSASRPIASLLVFAAALVMSIANAQVAAPQLKWAYGGCFASWCQTGWYASPAVADLDGDGAIEVVWASYDLVALSGADGAVEWRAASDNRVFASLALTDIDADGAPEIVAARSGPQLAVHEANGAPATGFPLEPLPSGEARSVAVADLDGDGTAELVVASTDHDGGAEQINVFEHTGARRPGWPARRSGEEGFGAGIFHQALTLADLAGDDDLEVFAPTDTHYITALYDDGSQVAASAVYGSGTIGGRRPWSRVGVHVDQEADLRGYAECGIEHRPNFYVAAPAVADVDGDGAREFIVAGGVYDCSQGDPEGQLGVLPWILNADRTRWSGAAGDWTDIPSLANTNPPLSLDYNVIENAYYAVVPVDLDGDGALEILHTGYDGKLHAYWLDRTEHHAWPFDVPGEGIRYAAEPVVVDLDDDGFAEVIFTSWPQKGGGRRGQLHVLNHRGETLHAVDLPAPRSGDWNGGMAAPTLAQLDGDADLEVVIGTSHSGVVAYDLPGSAGARVLWGTGRGDFGRTGTAPPFEAFDPQRIFVDGFEP